MKPKLLSIVCHNNRVWWVETYQNIIQRYYSISNKAKKTQQNNTTKDDNAT